MDSPRFYTAAMTIQIYHNPRCSKSREALALLQQQPGISVEIIDYLQTPPSPAQLGALLALLQLPARELLRSGEEAFQALGLDDPGLSEDALLAAIAAQPQLLQRPIVVNGPRAVIARPPELALTVL
jgi:arsenate reductase (glutaredoxin)